MVKLLKSVGILLLLSNLSFGYIHAAVDAKVTELYVVQQGNVCTGVVKDANGETIIGASVVVKGTTNGTITGLDGEFSLANVTQGDVLRISYVGYITQDIIWDGRSLSVSLKEDSKTLEEVVVVGYATVKKANLTGAVSAVDSKILEDRPIVNLGQGLQGAIPNLNVTTSGRPGEGSSFNIRGTTAMSGASPLVLVDGVEMDPNLINPQDVQSVSVLKDAASASIYGARAAYGVVLITTKGGKRNQPTKVSLDASLSFNGPTTRPTYMTSMEFANWMNAAQQTTTGNNYFDAEWMQHIEAYYKDPANNSPVFVHSDPNKSQNGTLYSYAGNTNWTDALYKKSYPVQKYNMNISGGGEKATYYTSLGFMDQGSLMRYGNEGYRKYNMMNNISYDITDKLHFSMKTSFNRTELEGLNQSKIHGDSFRGSDASPLMPVKHPDGNWAGQGNVTNFAAVLEQGGTRQTRKNDFWNTMVLKLTPITGMTVNVDYTFNYYAEHNKYHLKAYNEYGVDGKFLNIFPWTNPSSSGQTQANDTYNAFNFFGDYEKSFGKHYLKAMIGFNQETKHATGFNASREQLISTDLGSLSYATGERTVGCNDDSWATRSTFFRVNYNYDERYLLEVNGRYDLSSKFPKDDRAVFNPSLSAAWRISNEKWFKELTNSFLDELKFRASYGSLGNQALSNGWYAYLSSYGAQQLGWIMGSTQPQYVTPGGLISSSITWETVHNGILDWTSAS